MTEYGIVKSILKTQGIRFEENYSLSKHSSFRIGGCAALAIFPQNETEFIGAVVALKENRIKTEMIGNASNILFADGLIDRAFIFTSGLSEYYFKDNFLFCQCGASFTAMSKKAADRGLSGMEFAYGIPGSVGGAVFMNAGAYGSCVSEILVSSTVFDMESTQIRELTLEEHKFDYRKSCFMDSANLVCLGAKFELKQGNKADIIVKMNEFINSRKEKQPLEYPNAGSYFKRPEGHFAGKLIEDCGLKGFRIGDAAVSQKHAGFIVNLGNATAGEVLALEDEIKSKVLKTYGVLLEREVRVITNDV